MRSGGDKNGGIGRRNMVKENLANNTSGYLGRRDNRLDGKLSDSPALSHSQQSSPVKQKVEPLEIEAKAAEELK